MIVMWASVSATGTGRKRAALLCAVLAVAGCRRAPAPQPPLAPQVSGTMIATGIGAPIRIVRDTWGVPHIYASTPDDLFFAQGFVQAQDRLFQMDLWRRASQGRLAEVLGSNFIGRDAMTRRVQYTGDLELEWASYGPDARAIVGSFVRGVNAWVALARERPPEEFVRAGWRPEVWRAEDLLARTDAFVTSGDALGDVFRAALASSLGVARAGTLLAGDALVPSEGLDLRLVPYSVGDAVRQVGTRPFFLGSNAWAVSGARSATGRPLLANDPHRDLDNPSHFYLVHLHAPGWNVAGATPPWLPGVMLGHNESIAWGMTAVEADTEDVYVERLNPENRHQVDARGQWVNTRVVVNKLRVNGRKAPVDAATEITPHGISLAVDRGRQLAFSIRWSGTEPGTAAGLGALALDRARSWPEFRAALGRWKMPAQEVVYADADGNIGSQVAALVPLRRGWNGALPVPAWTGRYEWDGWRSLDDLPHTFNPASGQVASANRSEPRLRRLGDVFAAQRVFDVDGFTALQRDVLATSAERLVPLLGRLHADREDVERARGRLIAWDRRMSADSEAATTYAAWESRLQRQLAARRIAPGLLDEFLDRARESLVAALIAPTRTWFDGGATAARDRLLVDALAGAVDDLRQGGQGETSRKWERRHRATFRHPLGTSPTASARFNIGPFPVPGYRDTLMSTDGRQTEVTRGPSFAAVYDVHDWDRSAVLNAPGQSGSPASPHFGDLAARWAAGEYFPMVFSDAAVKAKTESTLTLLPPGDEVVRRQSPVTSR